MSLLLILTLLSMLLQGHSFRYLYQSYRNPLKQCTRLLQEASQHSTSKTGKFVIKSSTNNKVQLFKSLQQKRKRDALNLIVLEGGRMIHDAISNYYKPHLILMTSEAYYETDLGRQIKYLADLIPPETAKTVIDGNQEQFVDQYSTLDTNKNIFTTAKLAEEVVESSDVEKPSLIYLVSDAVYKGISETTHGQGIIATFQKPTIDKQKVIQDIQSRGSALIVILDGISDPGNMGTIIRSCHGLGVNLMLSVNSCDIYNSKVIRASMGSVLAVPIVELDWSEAESCLREVRQLMGQTDKQLNEGYQIVLADGTSDTSIPYTKLSYISKHTVLVLGSEAHGISLEAQETLENLNRELSGKNRDMIKVNIPMAKKLESFNVAVAGSVILSEISRQVNKH